MFNFFRKNDSIIKGFKVCKNSDRSKKYGIGADSFKCLIRKIEEKLEVKNFKLFYSDSLLLDDEAFFKTIPNQSNIVIVEEGEEYKTELDVIFGILHKIYNETFLSRDLINKFIRSDQNEELIKTVLDDINKKTIASDRENHEEWFQNIDKKGTKEDIMKGKARDRIKGYFYKTKDELIRSRIYQTNIEARKIVDDLLSTFFVLLSGVNFFECLFDRSHENKHIVSISQDEIDAKTFIKRRKVDKDTKDKIKESKIFEKVLVSLCDESGTFTCHGNWNLKKCGYQHKINPYVSRESFILFQIFNLDHQIEISRTIFPSLIRNIERLCTGKNLKCEEHDNNIVSISTITYFLEIFTVENLKLVHIICHDKGSHSLSTRGRLLCDECKEMKEIKKLKMKFLV